MEQCLINHLGMFFHGRYGRIGGVKGCNELSKGYAGPFLGKVGRQRRRKNTYCIDMFMVRAIFLRKVLSQGMVCWALHYAQCLDGLGRH